MADEEFLNTLRNIGTKWYQCPNGHAYVIGECGLAMIESRCPECGEDSLRLLGVGTEKIEEEIAKEFDASVVRMDLDTTSKKGAHNKIIEDFKNHKYDILLGTQMIAKGLDFDNVTLVGVINADTSLLFPNFRSSEYTYQLLSQVSGRSGRGEKEGEVIIQTHNPEHYFSSPLSRIMNLSGVPANPKLSLILFSIYLVYEKCISSL